MFIKGWFYQGVKLSKWENVNESTGRKSVSYSIEKSYKDKNDGEYKTTSTFFSNDIDSLIHCLQKAKQDSVKEIFPKETTAQDQQTTETANTYNPATDQLADEGDVPF